MKYIALISAIFGIFYFTSCDSPTFQIKKSTISVSEVKNMLKEDILFIDVRNYDEVNEIAYDVKNIKNIPLDSLQNHLKDIPKNKQIILLCRSGRRSFEAYTALKNNGYSYITSLEGGLEAWEAAGLPTIINAGENKKCNSDSNCKTCIPGQECKDLSTNENATSGINDNHIQQAEAKTSNTSTKIIIYAFHGTRQCETCINMKTNTKIALEKYFINELKSGKITYRIIDVDDSKNEKIAEKFQATGTSLFAEKINGGNDLIFDWTDFAFDNANNSEVYISEFKTKVTSLLK
jgi:rhodanese-related sulfurtransferase